MAELIVALDLPAYEDALRLVERTGDGVGWYKVGYQAFYAYGERIIAALHESKKSLFLDLKLHDIPNTVAAAVQALARFRPRMLTVHAAGGGAMMSAAVAARAQSSPETRLIAVTLLTSLTSFDLHEDGVAKSAEALAASRAESARRCGLDGVVCAVAEAQTIRAAAGREFLIVTPGIRPAGSDRDDQARTATPADAAKAGADFIVVGRPIAGADDPRRAAQAITDELRAAV
jgi:orotidine-5'-phosphate decarboxylase